MSNLRNARIASGLNQKQVALYLKVSAPTVSEWESGKKNPNTDNLRELAKLYNVDVNYLLGLTDDPSIANFSEKTIGTATPIQILSCQYNITSDVMMKIAGVSRDIAEKWVAYGLEREYPPNNEQLLAISNFFEVSIENLHKGILLLFPKDSVQNKAWKIKREVYPHNKHLHEPIETDEDALLNFYRISSEEDKRIIYKVALNLAQSAKQSSQLDNEEAAATLDKYLEQSPHLQTNTEARSQK